MADERPGPVSPGPADEVHDDDELADVLAAELERYATGAMPVVGRGGVPDPVRPVVLRLPAAEPSAARAERPTGRRAAQGASSALDGARPRADSAAFQRPRDRMRARDDLRAADPIGRGRRSMGVRAEPPPTAPDLTAPNLTAPNLTAPNLTGPGFFEADPLLAEDAPIRRRSGFRPPTVDAAAPPSAPMDRVLPTGPVSLPEATATLLQDLVAESGDARAAARAARHASADPGQTAPTHIESAQVEPTRIGSAQVEPTQVEPTRIEPVRIESVRIEPVRVEPVQIAATGIAAQIPPLPASGGRGRLDGTGPVRVDAPDPLVDRLPEVLRSTGPLSVPRPLYSDWEQSLRSIGRPRAPWDDAPPQTGPLDAPTVAMQVQRTGGAPATSDEPVLLAPLAPTSAPAGGDPSPPTGRIRRGRRRAAAVAAGPETPLPPPMPIESDAAGDAEGIDDVAASHPRISAATTGAVDVPLSEPRPRTGPVLVERMRTAILQLPVVPDSPTGSGAAALVGRWIGAFASPVVLLLAFGVAAAGAGPAGAVLAIAGVLAAIPAAARSASWAARAEPRQAEERALLGDAGGRAWEAVLLLARIAAAGLALFAVAAIATAWAVRTGALGGSAATAPTASAGIVGLLALLVALLPLRAAAVLVQLAAAGGVVATVLLLLLLAPTTGAAPGTAEGAVAAAVAGVGVGLLVLLCGADLVRWRTDLPSPARAATGTVLGALGGAVVLAAAVLVAGGARGDPADGFAAALSDGSAADLAAPLGVVLLAASLVLPVLLLRSSGAAAARLLGGGGPRLGTAAAGLLALAGCLGLLALAAPVAPAAIAVAGFAGVPVAAWAGVRTSGAAGGRRGVAAVGSAVGVLAGWSAADGLLPGLTSPVLDAIGVSGALRGGPLVGLAVAAVVGLVAGAAARTGRAVAAAPTRGPADTVEG